MMAARVFSWDEEELKAWFGDQLIFTIASKEMLTGPVPLQFQNIVLRPGGEPLLHAIWRFREGGTGAPVDLLDFEAAEMGPERLQLSLHTRSQANPWVVNATTVEVSYDADRDRFLYDVEIELEPDQEHLPDEIPGAMEFFNLKPYGIIDDWLRPGYFDPAVLKGRDDPGAWATERLDFFLYEEPGDATVLLPVNQYNHSHTHKEMVQPQGRLAFVNHPAGNPTVRLKDDTTLQVFTDRCHLVHDEHIIGQFNKRADGRGFEGRQRVHFVLYDSYGEESDELISRAHVKELPATDLARVVPRREVDLKGYDSFERPHRMDEVDKGDFWVPVSGWDSANTDWWWCSPPGEVLAKQCIWDRTHGRTGRASLKVVTDDDGRAGWESLWHPIFLRPQCRYLLSCYVRTRDLKGKGAFLGYFFGPDEAAREKGEPYEVRANDAGVAGTTDWTYLEHTFTAGKYGDGIYGPTCLFIRMWHEGRGISWWDDLVLLCLDDEYHEAGHYRRAWQPLPRQVVERVRQLRS